MAVKVFNVLVLVLLLATEISSDGTFVPNFLDEDETTDLVKEGKRRYEVVVQESKMPKYGGCWKKALSRLQKGCSDLTDDTQAHMALDFTNCFLEKAGLQTHPCHWDTEISVCLKDAAIHVYTAYTNFFTHTHSMCVFLKSQVWHEETEKTIERLSQSSAYVHQSLEESRKLQLDLLDSQTRTLETQEKLLENGNDLSKYLELSKDNIREVVYEFKSSTDEQRMIIMDVFDRVGSLQSLLLGEFTGFYSYLFYAVAIIISYLVTSTSRTNSARFWVFVIITVNAVLERAVIAQTVNENIGYLPEEASVQIYYRVWLCRKICCATALLILAYCSIVYKDYNMINNHLLLEIKQQNQELQNYMQSVRGGSFGQNLIQLTERENGDTVTKTISTMFNRQAIRETYLHDSTSEDDDDNICYTAHPVIPRTRECSPFTRFGREEAFASLLRSPVRNTHHYGLREKPHRTQSPVIQANIAGGFSSFIQTIENDNTQVRERISSVNSNQFD